MEIYFLILILSVVQSLFGVGLLLFGTPILLLMGYEYTEVLMYLLPASISISLGQVRDFRNIKLNQNYRLQFFIFCIPILLVGIFLATKFDLKIEIRLFIVSMLLFSFFLRTFSTLRTQVEYIIQKNIPFVLCVMGLVHGLSNMGGSILGPMASSLYKDKNKILASVSLDYALMAMIQFFYLVIFQDVELKSVHVFGALIALIVRYFLGKRVFEFTTEKNYQRLLNGFILMNAIVLGVGIF
jgi:uncharacterized membrane protein YfcA